MSLTGRALPVLLGLLTIGVFLVLALGYPRSRRVLATAVRSVLLVLLAVLVLATTGVVLNHQYEFYVSWGDLLGQVGPGVVSSQGASVGGAGGPVAATAADARLVTPTTLPPLPDPGGRRQLYRVHGRHSGITGTVIVYLPEGYRADGPTRYPVIEALHGFPSSPQSWGGPSIDLPADIHDAVTAGQVAAPIVVAPQINVPRHRDTECVNAPRHGLQTETWLARDVPEFVASHYRVRTDRSSWSALGFSYGGWCAAVLGMHHPATFGTVGVLLGYFEPDFTDDYLPFGPDSNHVASYDLLAQARRDPPALAMYVLTSRHDPVSHTTSEALFREARAPLSVTAVRLPTGGHRNSVFTPYLPRYLAWLGAAQPGFRPRPAGSSA